MADYRTLFISDVHLGTRAAQADLLLDFLKETEADTIYLVGDIVDFWRIRRGAIWPQSHNDVLQKLLRKVRKGTRVVFIPGNHDEGLRQYCGQHFGGIEIEHQTVHTTADGRRYLVIHGDEFDVVVRYAKWLAFLGDRGYELALWMNHPLELHPPPLRARLLVAVGAPEAARQDGRQLHRRVREIACPTRRAGAASTASSAATSTTPPPASIDDIHYLNTGDWVESCTAIGEKAGRELRAHPLARRDRGAASVQTRSSAYGSPAGRLMRILIATDAWHPQVNGVVRTYERLIEQLGPLGVELSVLAPHEFRTVPARPIPRFALRCRAYGASRRGSRPSKPEAVHIATEGPIGWMARRYCRARRLPFTTSFHTRFPEYLAQRFAIPHGVDDCGPAPLPQCRKRA